MKIVFLILNYNTYQETIECVQSIEKMLDTDEYRIVIVDNASEDDSADRLDGYIKDKQKIELIRNSENLGFAKGNNVGIRYINETYKPEYLVVLNSDTELIQSGLCGRLDREFENSGFALLGPLILTADGRCDNSPESAPELARMEKDLRILRMERIIIKYGFYRFYCGGRFFKNVFLQKVLKKSVPAHNAKEFQRYQRQVVLQGCFLVFSRKAFDSVEGFDERTFLYYEEPLLYLSLVRQGLVTVYTPEIVVYHKEGRASNIAHGRDRLLFINRCYQDSVRVLIDTLRRMSKEGSKGRKRFYETEI